MLIFVHLCPLIEALVPQMILQARYDQSRGVLRFCLVIFERLISSTSVAPLPE